MQRSQQIKHAAQTDRLPWQRAEQTPASKPQSTRGPIKKKREKQQKEMLPELWLRAKLEPLLVN